MKDEIATWQASYDADSPDTLRERAASSDVSADRAYELVQTASDWEFTRYQLSLIQDGLKNYDSFDTDPASISA